MNILPFITYLQILQLEYYQSSRLISWWLKHPLTFNLPQIIPLKFTAKAKLLSLLYLFQYLILVFLFLNSSLSLVPFLIILLLLLFTPLGLLFSQALIYPTEYILIHQRIHQSISLLHLHPHLTTIAITGSYGKTTTKDFLFQILDFQAPTLKTTHSYNTPLGIARTIQMGLTRHTRYFLAEFGAHSPHDIQQLAGYYPPSFAIITAIGPQHLDHFGSIDNILYGKFRIAQNLDPSRLLLNYDNQYIQSYLQSHPQYLASPTFSLDSPQATFYLPQHRFTSKGVKFTLSYQKHPYVFKAPIFGTSNLYNLLAAVSQAFILGLPYPLIKQAAASITSSPHRLELASLNRATLIDNTYSSNIDGFSQILSDLASLKGPKALITPGLVELGPQTAPVHQQLGRQAAAIFDEIILVGQNERTHNFAQGLKGSSAKITFITNRQDYWPSVRRLSLSHSWVLLENDLPQNY
jgi:UDP-N-acetylmuramoyl-tripeptide--D-alanyl-D-alanine ligase